MNRSSTRVRVRRLTYNDAKMSRGVLVITRVKYLSDVFEPVASPLGDPVGHLLVNVPVAVPDVAVQPDRERVGVQLGTGHGARPRHDSDEQGTPQQHGQQRPDGELVAAAAAEDPSVAVVAHTGAGIVRIAAVVVVRPGHVGRRDLVAGRPDYSNAHKIGRYIIGTILQ